MNFYKLKTNKPWKQDSEERDVQNGGWLNVCEMSESHMTLSEKSQNSHIEASEGDLIAKLWEGLVILSLYFSGISDDSIPKHFTLFLKWAKFNSQTSQTQMVAQINTAHQRVNTETLCAEQAPESHPKNVCGGV